MARVVAIHGVGHQFGGEGVVHADWLPALRSGLRRAGADLPDETDLACAFYGDLFRPGGRATSVPPYDKNDVEEGWEQELLDLWWREAARVEPQVPGPDARTRARTPLVVQRALNALTNSTYFAGLAENVLINDLKQAHWYLRDKSVRSEAQRRVSSQVGADTRVLVGHSLGSIVAYEALCAHPDWPVRTLVTIGSPLGIRNVIFDLLLPPPERGVGVWPKGVERWTNIADQGDIVALVKELRPLFGGADLQVEDRLVYNGAHPHSARSYLTAEETGRAIADGL
jgi:hypothetical protein